MKAMRGEGGYTAIEMITVMTILGVVLTGITTAFISGSKAELEMNKKFQAQTEARVALDKFRREVHCSQSATPVTASSTFVVLSLPSPCKTGTGSITWCSVGTGQRYSLYRSTSDPCDASDRRYADFLTHGNLFAYSGVVTAKLPTVHIELPVDIAPTDSQLGYRLEDDIVLRNATRGP